MKEKYFIRPFELFFIVLNISTYKIFTSYASLLPKIAGSSAPISALFSGVVVWLILYALLSLCEKNQAKSILCLAPPKLKFPFFLILTMFLLCSSASTLLLSCNLIKEVSLPQTQSFYIALLLLIAVVICCAQGFDAISRLHSVIIPIAIVLVIPVLLSASTRGTPGNLFPYLGYGYKKTFVDSLISTGLYGDSVILFMLFPFSDERTNLKKTALFSLGTGIFINTAIITVFTLLTPYNVSGTVSHPFLQLVKLFSAGKFFQRIDGYFMYAVSGCGILAIALNFFTISFSAKEVTAIPKIRPLAYSSGLFVLLSFLLIRNSEIAYSLTAKGLFLLFPLILFIFAITLIYSKLKRRKNI